MENIIEKQAIKEVSRQKTNELTLGAVVLQEAVTEYFTSVTPELLTTDRYLILSFKLE